MVGQSEHQGQGGQVPPYPGQDKGSYWQQHAYQQQPQTQQEQQPQYQQGAIENNRVVRRLSKSLGCCTGVLGIRDNCIGIGYTLVIIALANLIGIYFWPSKYTCQSAFQIGENVTAQVEFERSGRFLRGYYPYQDEDLPPASQEIVDKCRTYYGVYLGFNIIFAVSSFLSGLALLAGAGLRSPCACLASVILTILCISCIIGQTIPIYEFSIVRYTVDQAHRVEEMKETQKSKPEMPAIPLSLQKALSVLGCIFFSCLYIVFAVCAFGLERIMSREGGYKRRDSSSNDQLELQKFYPTSDEVPPEGIQVIQQRSQYPTTMSNQHGGHGTGAGPNPPDPG